MEEIIAVYAEIDNMTKGRPGPIAINFAKTVLPLQQVSKKAQEAVKRTSICILMERIKCGKMNENIVSEGKWTKTQIAHAVRTASIILMLKRGAERKMERKRIAEIEMVNEQRVDNVWDLLD